MVLGEWVFLLSGSEVGSNVRLIDLCMGWGGGRLLETVDLGTLPHTLQPHYHKEIGFKPLVEDLRAGGIGRKGHRGTSLNRTPPPRRTLQ